MWPRLAALDSGLKETFNKDKVCKELGISRTLDMFIRPIPFEDVLTILVSIFLLLRDEKKWRVSERLR